MQVRAFLILVLIFPSKQTRHNGSQQNFGGWSNQRPWTIHHHCERSAGASHLCSGSPSHSRTPLLKEGADWVIQGFRHNNFGSKYIQPPTFSFFNFILSLVKLRKDRTWVCLIRALTLSWSLISIWILQQNAGGHSRPWESCGSIEASGCCDLHTWRSSNRGSTETDYSNQGSGTHHGMSISGSQLETLAQFCDTHCAAEEVDAGIEVQNMGSVSNS